LNALLAVSLQTSGASDLRTIHKDAEGLRANTGNQHWPTLLDPDEVAGNGRLPVALQAERKMRAGVKRVLEPNGLVRGNQFHASQKPAAAKRCRRTSDREINFHESPLRLMPGLSGARCPFA
jgi:hypothetical protein